VTGLKLASGALTCLPLMIGWLKPDVVRRTPLILSEKCLANSASSRSHFFICCLISPGDI